MIRISTQSFTRPADVTAYASGDLAANSTTAGSVVPLLFGNVGPATIRRARITKTGTSTTNASFRLHLFTAPTITAANGDNGAFSTNQAQSYLGAFDVTVGRAFTDGASGVGVPASGQGTALLVGNANITGLLEVTAAYTPASAEVFRVELEIED